MIYKIGRYVVADNYYYDRLYKCSQINYFDLKVFLDKADFNLASYLESVAKTAKV